MKQHIHYRHGGHGSSETAHVEEMNETIKENVGVAEEHMFNVVNLIGSWQVLPASGWGTLYSRFLGPRLVTLQRRVTA